MLKNNYEVKNYVLEIIRDKACASDEIAINENTLLKEAKIDSFAFIEIIIALEDRFEVEFDDGALYFGKFEYVHDLVDYVDKLVKGKNNE